jgi:hypothetical protein
LEYGLDLCGIRKVYMMRRSQIYGGRRDKDWHGTRTLEPVRSSPNVYGTDSTQSMKVVASTKLTKAERAMREAKKYGAANNGES